MAEIETRVELIIPSPKKLFTPAVTVILILMVAGYALLNYAPDFTEAHLALSAGGLFSGQIWQLVTYSFLNCNGFILIFYLLLMLFVGSNIEREWGSMGLILFWLTVSIICGLIWVLVNYLAGFNYLGLGASACEFGLLAAFGILYRTKRFLAWFWVLQAQHAAWALIIIGIILSIPQPITLIWLTGVLVAYLYIKLRWRISLASSASSSRYKPQSFVDID